MYIPYGRQCIEQDDIDAVVEVLRSDYVTTGPAVTDFEKAVAEYTGAKYAVAVANGTAALHVACLAAGLKKGDEVITTPITFAASANCALYCGATPVFADIDGKTLTLTEATVAPKVTKNTRAVIADLPGGNPCDAAALKELCDKYGLKLILNLDDAWTAKWNGKALVDFADAAFVNFSNDKIIDLGLSAAVVTNDVENHKLFYAYHNCGRPWGVTESTLSFDAIMGGDLRVAEWQASLLPGRLEKLPEIDAMCKKQAESILAALPAGAAVVVAEGGEAAGRGVLAKGVEGCEVYPAMHLQPFFRDSYFETLTGCKLEYAQGDFPVSEEAAKNVKLVK